MPQGRGIPGLESGNGTGRRIKPDRGLFQETNIDIIQRVAQAYNTDPEREWNRLAEDAYHSLEFLVTWHYLQKYLPRTGTILDAGGGPGRYARELCRAGYSVVLYDISAGLLSFAKDKLQAEPEAVRSRLLDYVEGDVQNLSRFEADSFDAVMCLGPLTHVPAEAGRNKALSELVRVAKPGAVVFVGVGGYLAVLRTILAEFSDELLPPSFQTLVQTGDDVVGTTGTIWHFFRADELRRCAEGGGLQTLALAGCQGLSTGLIEATNAIGQDEAKWRRWAELVIQTSAEAAVADMAEHILYVGRAVKAEHRPLNGIP